MNNGKPVVAVFSDSNFLSLSIIENLLSRICNVVVFAPDKNKWLQKTRHITNKTNLEILDERVFLKSGPIDYAIFCLGFLKKEGVFKKFKAIYSLPGLRNVKSLAIFPFEIFNFGESNNLSLNTDLGILYIGDLLGSRIDIGSELLLPRLLTEIVAKGKTTLAVGEVFYPVFVASVAKQVTKWIFSFGPYGKETFLLGDQVSGTSFWREITRYAPDIELSYHADLQARILPKGYEIEIVPGNLTFMLKETFLWLSANVKFRSVGGRSVGLPKIIREKSIGLRRFKISLAVVIPIFLFPLLCLVGSASLFFASYKIFMKGRPDSARNLLLLSKIPSLAGKNESAVLKYIPLFGKVYKETYFGLGFLEKSADLAVDAITIAEESRQLFEKAFGNEIYDPEKLADDIRINLQYIYQTLSLVELDTKSQAEKRTLLAKYALQKVDFERMKKLSLQGSQALPRLADVLGKSERKTYLILFENNMELRPTGGFIGSFGLLTLEGGRMADLSVSDVYSADGQLKGHVEPPKPIKDFLGEANWWLRDSNWDPDFPTSAQRAEWFLDKEVDRQVEGVVSIDLSPVKEILKYTGPIFLADYNMEITSDNLYEKVQEEVQKEFFPGTHKKASFLTALSRNLVAEVSNLDSGKKLKVLKEFFESLESRHIQVYLHDQKFQDSVSSLGWSGEVLIPSCGDNCYTDLVGVVEANVGVNKANYFITRNEKLKVEILPDGIRRELDLEIKNSANPGLGAAGKYKAYIRILVPQDSDVEGNLDVYEAKNRKEIGFLAEVLGGQNKKISISWSSPIRGVGNYGLYVRKQAGVEDGGFSLTVDGNNLYNSTLAKDIWIQKP